MSRAQERQGRRWAFPPACRRIFGRIREGGSTCEGGSPRESGQFRSERNILKGAVMGTTHRKAIVLSLVLVLTLSLCACAQKQQTATEADKPNISDTGETLPNRTDKERPGKQPGGSDTQPAQAGFSAEAEQSLVWLRDRIDFPQTMFGAAYLGYVEEGGDWLSAADQAMLEAYPFLAEIDENHIIGSTGYLYCIVPVDKNASVAINRMQWNEKTKTYENTEVCYRSESGEPVLLFANLDGVAYEADTQVWITDNSGNCCEWWPSFDAMSYLAPCISETGDYLSFDFTEYGWRGVPSELAPWLADGWSGIYAPGLEGCWTVQAAAWDTGRTANYYLWFFPEDENGGSVRLDWQYEGSDLFEEMWSGYWTITSVMDGPSYVTISLSLVGGENYGVTDGPYYISDTYPLVIDYSGEKMVLGAGENGVSLPFMPKYESQLSILTLDSWLTESPDW